MPEPTFEEVNFEVSGITEPTGAEAPIEPTAAAAPEVPLIEVDGRKVPQPDVIDAYKNLNKWRLDQARRGQDLNRKEAEINAAKQAYAQYDYLVQLDRYFAEHPGQEQKLREFVSREFAATPQATPQGAVPGGDPRVEQALKETQTVKAELEQMKQDKWVSEKWSDFRGRNPGVSMKDEAAIRGLLPVLNTDDLDYAYSVVKSFDNPAGGQGTPPTSGYRPGQAALAGATAGGAPAPGVMGGTDLSKLSFEQVKRLGAQALARGDYNVEG